MSCSFFSTMFRCWFDVDWPSVHFMQNLSHALHISFLDEWTLTTSFQCPHQHLSSTKLKCRTIRLWYSDLRQVQVDPPIKNSSLGTVFFTYFSALPQTVHNWGMSWTCSPWLSKQFTWGWPSCLYITMSYMSMCCLNIHFCSNIQNGGIQFCISNNDSMIYLIISVH